MRHSRNEHVHLLELENHNRQEAGSPVKLDLNEAACELPRSLKRRIARAWLQADWRRYPQRNDRSLLELVGRYCGHDPEGICLGAGSNELILALGHAFLGPGKTLLIADPSFLVYERVGRILGARVARIPLGEDFRYNLTSILQTLKREKPDLTILPSPHNPCGDILEKDEVASILKTASGAVAVDEAYYEFSGTTVRPLLERSNRLFVLRTFSKAFSLAGLRTGYLLGRPEAIRMIRKLLLPYNLSSLNQIAIRILLAQPEAALRAAASSRSERDRLARALAQLRGVEVFPSRANFFLFRVGNGLRRKIPWRLKARGIAVRSFSHPRLKNCYRVSVGTKKENRFFLDALKEVVNGQKKK